MGTLNFDGTDFSYQWWSGQQLRGTAECPLAYDSETSKLPPYRQPLEGEDPAELPPCPLTVPTVAVAMAYDGNQLVLIHPTRLKDFLAKHRSQYWAGQNFSFDFHVLLKHFRSQRDAISEEYLWRLGDDNRLCDTGILDLLLQLGTGKYRMGKGKGKSSGGDDKKLLMTNLAVLSEEWGCGELDKTDPYRLRFGEWVGLSEQQIEQHPEFANFAAYALKDVIATWRVYPKQRKAGIEIMRKAGWSPDPKQRTYEIRPDALQKFGVLSEYVQVKGSIVLDQLSRTPLHIDVAKREEMEAATRKRYQLHMNSLLELEPDLFRRYSDKSPKKHLRGQIQTNKKTGLPKMNNSVLKRRLEEEAARLFIDAPISKGKNKAISLSAKDWDHLREQSGFLNSWCSLGSEVKLLSFFLSMQSPDGLCYSRYNLLMRTGRTSAQQHKSGGVVLVPSFNIQQMPREDEKHPERSVRGLFRPPEGCLWGSVDYSYLELRSLAAVCKARFGHSVLSETIYKHTKQGGLDPHQRMAASILNVSEPQFVSLEKKVQKDARQKGKAASFGFPGGLGIEKFVAYAALQYKTQFTKAEAKEVKQKWFTLYPEMRQYLEDPTELAMKWQTDAVLAPKLTYLRRRRLSDYLKLSDKDREKKFTNEEEIDGFWSILNWIAKHKQDPQLTEDVEQRRVTAAVRNLVTYRASTLTGRVRNNVTYTAGANSPFQGTAADGAKEALWRLVRKGVRLMGFVHDSVEVAIPKGKERSIEPLVNRVLIEAMEFVLGQGVPVAVEGSVSDGWTKP